MASFEFMAIFSGFAGLVLHVASATVYYAESDMIEEKKSQPKTCGNSVFNFILRFKIMNDSSRFNPSLSKRFKACLIRTEWFPKQSILA